MLPRPGPCGAVRARVRRGQRRKRMSPERMLMVLAGQPLWFRQGKDGLELMPFDSISLRVLGTPTHRFIVSDWQLIWADPNGREAKSGLNRRPDQYVSPRGCDRMKSGARGFITRMAFLSAPRIRGILSIFHIYRPNSDPMTTQNAMLLVLALVWILAGVTRCSTSRKLRPC